MERPHEPQRFLTAEETEMVQEAVARAEKRTSAEIKVVVHRYGWVPIQQKALDLFDRLGLRETAARNGVLILLVTTNHEFVIYGDEGIHAKVGMDFWTDVRDEMAACFREGRFGDGLRLGVERAGEKLHEHFPWQEGDVNELPDDVVVEDN